MNDTDIERRLAELCRLSYQNTPPDGPHVFINKWWAPWHPLSNIEQAVMCLDKFDSWSIERGGTLYGCQIHRPIPTIRTVRGDGHSVIGAIGNALRAALKALDSAHD